MSWLAPLLDLGTSLVSGGLNYYGSKKANEMNQKIAREQMDFQRSSTREQMGFQERMSNTAYQRTMQDMRSAGINPMLAFSQGGASTPSGASSAGSSYTSQNEFSRGISSALQARQMQANVEQAKIATEILRAELAGKQVEASIWNSSAGKLLKVLQMVNPSVNSAMNLMKMVK